MYLTIRWVQLQLNIVGSFFMGFLVGWVSSKVNDVSNLMLFLGVGLLGGFTTFSAFSLEAFTMYEKKGLWLIYFIYWFLRFIFCGSFNFGPNFGT
jgi:fluoride ion exporter CrcB/FEX